MNRTIQKSPLEDAVRAIVAAGNAGHRQQALMLCWQALAEWPDDAALTHLLATLLARDGQSAAALDTVRRSLDRVPQNLAARLLAGRLARTLGDTGESCLHFEAAVALRRDAETLRELARALDACERSAEARACWNDVRSVLPRDREAAARLGRLAWEAGDAESARSLLEEAVTGEAPASAWFDLGLARQDCADLPGAADAFAEALKRRPDDGEIAYNRAVVLQDMGDIDGACDAYRQAYRLAPQTIGMIANALTSAPVGRLFLDRADLEAFLAG